jgi:hypothetical protein
LTDALAAQATGPIRIDIPTGAFTRPVPSSSQSPPTVSAGKANAAIPDSWQALHIRFRFDTWGKFFSKKIELRKFPPLKSNSFTC